MQVDIPEVVEEVTAVFRRYEQALMANDLAVLEELFWDAPEVVRYGLAEQLYGPEHIRRFRALPPPADLQREITRLQVTAFGRDVAVASCEFRRLSTGRKGRQMQTWIRTPAGWRVAAAHVSLLREGA